MATAMLLRSYTGTLLTVETTEVNDATMKLLALSNSDGAVFEVAGDGAVTVHSGGLLVDAGGLEVSAGGLVVDSGGVSVDGGLQVVDGGTILNASSGVALTVNGLGVVRFAVSCRDFFHSLFLSLSTILRFKVWLVCCLDCFR